MRTLHSRAALLLLALIVAGCAPPNTISGKVVADGAPLAGQIVVLQAGSELVTATTGTDGAYLFDHLDTRSYLLSVDVPSTVEHHLQSTVSVSGSTPVPDLVFHGIATVSGTVTSGDAPVSNAQVVVLGTELAAISDAQGAFTFTDVPSGDRALSVTTSAAHASTQVTVARGEVKTVQLSLAANPPGTVTGKVGFFTPFSAAVITLSVPGTPATTTAQPDGSFSLDLPPGTWDVLAQAPYYPSQKVGTVTVASGQTVALAPAILSLYTDLPTFGIPGAVWTATGTADAVNHDATVLELAAPSAASSFFRFDLHTHALTLLSVGASPPALSPDGAWAAVPQTAAVLFFQPGTANGFTVPLNGATFSWMEFFPDNTAAFIITSAPAKVLLVKLATQVVTSAIANSIHAVGSGRLLVQTNSGSPINFSSVTSNGIVPAFNQVTNLIPVDGIDTSAAYAIQACATAPCPVMVLGPNATSAVPAQGVTSSGTLSTTGLLLPWLKLQTESAAFLVNVETGAATNLAGTTAVAVSPDGTRVAFVTGGGSALYVTPLPLPSNLASLTPVQTATSGLFGTWIGDHYVGFNNSPTTGSPHKFVVDGSGALTVDADYTPGSGAVGSRYARYKGSDGVARIHTGGGYVITAPNGQTTFPDYIVTQVHLRRTAEGLAYEDGSAVATSWDGSNTMLYGPGTPPHTVFGISLAGGSTTAFDNLFPTTNGASLVGLDVTTGQVGPLFEPGISTAFTMQASLTETSTTLLVAPRLDANGTPTGGAFVIVPTFLD